MTSYKRGDVILVRFPNSDLRTYKKRPALVVQADGLETGIPQIIVAMITSNTNRSGHPSRIHINPALGDESGTGLQNESVIVTDNLATVKDSFIDKAIGKFTNMERLDAALANTFGLRLR